MFKLPKICYGCSACSVICPKDAIKMKLNEEGMFSPFFSEKKCINCNLCNTVCISKNTCERVIGRYGIYAGWSNNKEIREKSTSGGVATEILRYASEAGMYTCGVIYDKEDRIARHVITEPFADVYRFMGVKYLQSYNETAFKQIISKHCAVVVSTPCQIAGLDLVLRKIKKRNNYILVELICKSVPTYKLYYKYINNIILENGMQERIEVKFRDSEKSWKEKYICIEDETGKRYSESENNDAFLKLFLNGYGCAKSCYECKYCLKSEADIRIGDFWGPRFEHAKDIGYSMVLANSKRGYEYLKKINVHLKKVNMSEYMWQKVTNMSKPKDFDLINKYIMNEEVSIEECASKIPSKKATLKHRVATFLPSILVIQMKKLQWKKICKIEGTKVL